VTLHTHRTFTLEQVDLNKKAPTCGAFAEPSDGLEPSTASLPFWGHGKWSQPTATDFAYLSGFRRRPNFATRFAP
jgi:hypothetical protein